MKLRKALFISLLCIFLLLIFVLFAHYDNKAKEDAINTFYEESTAKLQVIDDYIVMFFDLYKEHIIELSEVPELIIAEKDFPMYREHKGDHTWTYETLSAPGKKVVEIWRELVLKDDDIVDIYAGFESGSSISYEAYEFPVGFLGAERPWYKEAKDSNKEVNIGHAYLSLSGKTVTPVTHKIHNTNGQFIGVIGLDISLETITKYLEGMNFNKTGHFVFLESSGRIICNSKRSDYNFRFIHELPDLAWEKIFISEQDRFILEFNDKKKYLVTSFFGKSGYRFLAISSEEEALAKSYTNYEKTLLLGTLGMMLVGLVYFCFRKTGVKRSKI